MFHSGYMGFGMGFGWIVFIIVIGMIIYLLFANKKTPKDILDERFAKGEISKEEYEEALKALKD